MQATNSLVRSIARILSPAPLLLVAAALALAAPGGDALPGPYAATQIRVIDGDTFAARVRIWLGTDVEVLVRLAGVDAAELRGACDSERQLARAARARLEGLLAGAEVWLREVRYDKYAGRVLARVETDGRDVAATLAAEGLARPYAGGARGSWCAD